MFHVFGLCLCVYLAFLRASARDARLAGCVGEEIISDTNTRGISRSGGPGSLCLRVRLCVLADSVDGPRCSTAS